MERESSGKDYFLPFQIEHTAGDKVLMSPPVENWFFRSGASCWPSISPRHLEAIMF